MKRRAMNSLASSLCSYLCSRNNDIAGYWGIGVLCAIAKREGRAKFRFKVVQGEPLLIYGCEITRSNRVTDKLVRLSIDSIEGCLSFIEDGRFRYHDAERYRCSIAIAVTQGGRTGMSMSHVECWPHDPSRESSRSSANLASVALTARLKKLLG